MSLELGGRNKSVKYLNLTKVGKETINDKHEAETCNVTYKTTNNPFLKNQGDYMCAMTRFSVPLTEVPIIDTHTFSIWKFRSREFRGYMNLISHESYMDVYGDTDPTGALFVENGATVEEERYYLQEFLDEQVEVNMDNLVKYVKPPPPLPSISLCLTLCMSCDTPRKRCTTPGTVIIKKSNP